MPGRLLRFHIKFTKVGVKYEGRWKSGTYNSANMYSSRRAGVSVFWRHDSR